MARTSSTTATGRSRITSNSKDLLADDGTFLASVVNGEQVKITFTLNWLVNLTGVTITAKVVEGDNTNLGTAPEVPAASPTIKTLTIIDSDTSDNQFSVVFPEDLLAGWSQTPLPNKPVYGFFEIEVADGGGDTLLVSHVIELPENFPGN